MLGQSVWVKALRKVSNLEERLDLHEFPTGQYFVKVLMEDGKILTRKVILL